MSVRDRVKLDFKKLARSMADFSEAEDGYLVDDFVHHPSLVFLYAPTGGMKSLLALDFARAVATGGNFLERETPQKKVLYLDGEMSDRSISKRSKSMNMDDIPADQLVYTTPQDKTLDFNDLDTQDEFIDYIKDENFEFVVIDNLRVLYSIDDENSAACFSSFNTFISKIRALNCSVLVIHHANKSGENYAGSTNIVTVYDISMSLSGEATDLHKQLRVHKNRDDTDIRHLDGQYVTFSPDGFKLNSTVGVDLESVVNELIYSVIDCETKTISEAALFLRSKGVSVDGTAWSYQVLQSTFILPYGSVEPIKTVDELKALFKAPKRLPRGKRF